jgi:hypothetical protein
MAKAILQANQNALLAPIATSTHYTFCSAQPANFAGIAAVTLATTTPTFSAIGAGTPNGRTLTVNAVSGVAVTTAGTVSFLALDDGTNLQFVDTCTAQAVSAGGTLSAASWLINVSDPA